MDEADEGDEVVDPPDPEMAAEEEEAEQWKNSFRGSRSQLRWTRSTLPSQ